MVPPDCRRILDVGCATGALGELLKQRGARVVGVEFDPSMAAIAQERLDQVVVGNVEDWPSIREAIGGERFDCVICADVLEHLVDPWPTLKNLAGLLEPGGYAVASLPNVGHMDTLLSVFFRKRWPYRARGIHDQAHLRFFARRNMLDLFEHADLEVLKMARNYRIIERPHMANRYAKYLAAPLLRDLLTYQVILLGRLR